MMSEPPKVVIGLGNPGATYAATRHNAGFWLLDALLRTRTAGAGFSPKGKFYAEAAVADGVHLFKPQTYMNESGRTAQAVTQFYQIPCAQVLVVHDEVDLPPGSAKLKHGGGDAGHRGLADISRQIGGGYWRLRLGVGKPAAGGVRDYVLQMPPAAERARVEDAIDAALAVWDKVLAGDYNSAMHTLHTATAPLPDAPHNVA